MSPTLLILILLLVVYKVTSSIITQKPRLSLSGALDIIEKCHERAKSLNVKVSVAVCDNGGLLIGVAFLTEYT